MLKVALKHNNPDPNLINQVISRKKNADVNFIDRRNVYCKIEAVYHSF
jgi:hypothetical protein